MFHILTIFKNHNAFLDQNLRTESGKKRLKEKKVVSGSALQQVEEILKMKID
tara:strand:- start:151748 stop:151903 length:156 start_codon:yes stop_codon:yes gene_type:complete